MNKIKQLSTTALSKKLNIPTNEMFAHLLQKGFIVKKGDVWCLTDKGVSVGGKFVSNEKFGKYITWPENINIKISQ